MEITNTPLPAYVLDAQLTQTDETAQASLPRLTVKGGKFIYRVGGELVNLGATVDIIVLAITPPTNYVNHRSWWELDYDPDEPGSPPDCFSDLGAIPDRLSPKLQSESCSTCEWSKVGSAGFKKAQACASFKIMYAVFPTKLDEIFLFKATITTLASLGNYRVKLKGAKYPIAGVLTRLSFDPDPTLDYCKTEYAYMGILPEELFKAATTLAASEPMKALVAGNVPVAQIEAPADTAKPIGVPFTPPPSPRLDGIPADNSTPDLPPPKPNPVPVPTPVPSPITAEVADTPVPQAADKVADTMLNELTPQEEYSGTQAIVQSLINSNTKKKMMGIYEAHKPTILLWEPQEKIDLRTILENKINTFKTPVGQLTTRLDECVNPNELLKLCSEIAELNVVDKLRHDFIMKANELNGTIYDPALHGQTKEKMPALCKDGSYKARKQANKPIATAPAPAPVDSGSTQPPTTAGSNEQASDEILRDLDLD